MPLQFAANANVDSVCDAGSPGSSDVMELWDYEHLPPNILLKIFGLLPVQSLVSAGLVCRTWHQIAMDDLLWRHLCLRDWILPSRHSTSTPTPKRVPPEGSSWYWEYKRLYYHTPRELGQVITQHRDQVLHVSFSHDGKLFATSSKDGTIKVWRTTQPAVLKYDYNMAEFHWKYTQFSQFNESDTLLLVSGVHIGTMSTSGEIAVFSLVNGFELQCRVLNKPYDVFGTWYNDTHLLSGNLHWVGHLNSCSALWLNKAWQAIETEQESVVMRLYRFYNDNASSIRTITIARCLTPDVAKPGREEGGQHQKPSQQPTKAMEVEAGTACPDTPHKAAGGAEGGETVEKLLEGGLPSGVGAGADNSCKPGPVPESGLPLGGPPVVEEMYPDKYLIFTMGRETYTPHMIGIKRIKSLELQAAHREGLRQPGRLRRQSVGSPPLLPDVEDNNHGMDRNRYDEVDFSFDLKGHIIGMALSPDHRHLFVNSRPWPKDAVVDNPIQPPPIAQEIDLHVFDLVQMQEVGGLFRSHRAYTPNDECFFIFLDVCNEYVASGAEDCFGYMWDRHYGICVNKFPHQDVVNCVGFNPRDSEMLVTVSDDKSIKIWLSRNRMEKVPRPQPEAARKSQRSLAPPPPVSI